MAEEQNHGGANVPGSPLKAEISFDSSAFSPSGTPQNRGSDHSPGSTGTQDHSITSFTANKKPRTTTVWNHFTERSSISDLHWEVKCLQCKTSYRIKKDGSTGTSTLHKHHRQCSGKLGKDVINGSPTPRQQHHTPTPDFLAQHDTSPSNHASSSGSSGPPTNTATGGGQSLVPNYSAQALQDFLRAAHQNSEQQQQQQQQQQQHSGHLGAHDFDMAATAAAAAASMANAYATDHQQQQQHQHHQHHHHQQQQQQQQQQQHHHLHQHHQQQQHHQLLSHHPQHQNGTSSEIIDVLVLNPNSSDSITMNLRQLLESTRPPGVKYTYMTGPPSAPSSISDPPTSILSAQTCFEMLVAQDIPSTKSAILVCCFSAHPLVPMLRHQWPTVPVMHILDTSINHAMSCGANTFGIITTGKAMIPDIDAGVRSYLGGVSDRYRGCIATGLGVLELGDLSMKDHVERVIKEESGRLAVTNGAEAIILGCAGMAGMESLVKQGVIDAGGSADKVWVIDGAKAGVQILNGIARCRYHSI
ncbi:unnamed protein product [Sympodiomycopsis kandeliae]